MVTGCVSSSVCSRRDLLAGHPQAALAGLQAVAQDEQEEHAGTLTVLATAALDAGDLTAANVASRKALNATQPRHNQLDLCEALLVRGQIAAHLEYTSEAEESFRQALALAEAMPYPYAEGRILYEGGLALRQADLASARVRLAAALAIFRRLGAHWYGARAEQALSGLNDEGRAPARWRP